MNLFDAPQVCLDVSAQACTVTPVDQLKEHVVAGDGKAALRYLRSLDKDTLSKLLLITGFSLSGKYREWINDASNDLLRCISQRRLLREVSSEDWHKIAQR